MRTAEIRRLWLDFFAQRDHTVVPSASLISPDPSTLFTIAGMVPFIPYMLGQQAAPWPRATSVQKCVRTQDIEEVGKTTRHGTFFQMNGNFSFGDYFKEGAIAYAWELVTGALADGCYGFDPDKVWVTVYHDDTEAAQLWKRIAGLPDERIQRRGKKDNYWHTGQPGPAARWSTRIASWRSGTSSSCSTRSTTSGPRTISGSPVSCPRRTSTRAWAWSASRTCCRASTTCTRSTRCSPSSPPPRSCRASATARTTSTTSGCAWWPTTSAHP